VRAHVSGHHSEWPDREGCGAADQQLSFMFLTGSPASRSGPLRSGLSSSPPCRVKKTSPTQPFPTKPAAYDLQGFASTI